jgi:hypothetical protein
MSEELFQRIRERLAARGVGGLRGTAQFHVQNDELVEEWYITLGEALVVQVMSVYH